MCSWRGHNPCLIPACVSLAHVTFCRAVCEYLAGLSSRCCRPQGDELTSPSEDSKEPWAKSPPCFLQFYPFFLMLLLKKIKQLASFDAAFTLASAPAFSLQEPPAVCPGKGPAAKLVWGNSDIQWSQVSPWFAKFLRASLCQGPALTLWWADWVSTEVNGYLALL